MASFSPPSPPRALTAKTVLMLLGVCTAGGVGIAIGLQSMRHELAAKVYKQKLEDLAGEYEDLRSEYNQAINQQAVTELVVQNGALTLSRRDAHGRVQTQPIEVDLSKEVYVDFIIHHDRLWIRSIFDSATPPEQAQVIDPTVWGVNWEPSASNEPSPYGLIAYRRLTEGRWVVTASQNAGLMLRRVADNEEIELVPAPPVRSFDTLEQDVAAEIQSRGVFGD